MIIIVSTLLFDKDNVFAHHVHKEWLFYFFTFVHFIKEIFQFKFSLNLDKYKTMSSDLDKEKSTHEQPTSMSLA